MMKLWKYISEIGFHDALPPEEIRRLRLLARLNFIAFGVLLLYVVLELVMAIYAFLPFILLVEIVLIIDLYLLHKRKYATAKYLSIITMVVTTGFFALTTGIGTLSEIVFIPIVSMPLVVLRSRKESFIILFAMVGILVGIKEIQPHITPLLDDDPNVIWFMNRMNLISALVVSFMLTYYFRIANEDYEQEILEANSIIQERNKEITDSITYAKRIQEAILPPTRLVKEWLPNSFILYKPKDIVAGDFYWMESINDSVIFAAADCTGHGVPGAMVSVVCNNAMNRSVREFDLKEPGQILDKTRELVIEQFEKSEEEVKDGMDIALCSLKGRTLQYAGAHNPLWVIKNGTEEVEEIKANKQPIGKFEPQTPYQTHSLELQEGDTIYIFSDGYADQFGGEKGKKFKSTAMKKLLLSIQDQPMLSQRQLIDEAFEKWRGDLEQVDDVCVIGVRI
jgi:serine phosphatase RsbU (regulator of sigma subunit)